MTQMDFDNGPILSMVDFDGKSQSNRARQTENSHVVDSNSKCETFEGHVTSDTCLADAKEYDVVNVSGGVTNDAKPVLSVETKGVVPSFESVGHGCSRGVVPGFASLGHGRSRGVVPDFESSECGRSRGVVPCSDKCVDSRVDCSGSHSMSNISCSSQLDCILFSTSSGKLDSDESAGESHEWELEKTFMDYGLENLETSQQHGNVDSNVLRQITGCPGIYVSGSVQGIKVQWTTDTGATRSILSKRMFEKIPTESRPKLEKYHSLTGVNGEPLIELGKALFDIQLGHENFKEEIIVAEIEDDALLGLDILAKRENAPVNIKLHENLITFRGKDIEVRNVTEIITDDREVCLFRFLPFNACGSPRQKIQIGTAVGVQCCFLLRYGYF